MLFNLKHHVGWIDIFRVSQMIASISYQILSQSCDGYDLCSYFSNSVQEILSGDVFTYPKAFKDLCSMSLWSFSLYLKYAICLCESNLVVIKVFLVMIIALDAAEVILTSVGKAQQLKCVLSSILLFWYYLFQI